MHHTLALLAAASLLHAPPRPPGPRFWRPQQHYCRALAPVAVEAEARISADAAAEAADAEDVDVGSSLIDAWSGYSLQKRHERLRDIALSISVRRTVDEAELGLRLADDFASDPSILGDIDFAALARRLERDMSESAVELRKSQLLPPDELKRLAERQREALAQLNELEPEVMAVREGAVAGSVPKLRRVISKARELPLTVELPAELAADGLDLSLALNTSKNVAVAVKEVWQRLNGADISREEELASLQRESKALLSLRSEATKLRAGIRLVQRQKELKSAYLVRFGESADLLGETLRADSSIMKLVKELSLKAALLEMERIYLVLESELSLTSALVEQLLDAVERYGELEALLREMVALVRADRHAEVEDAQLDRLEGDIAFLLLQLGLATADKEKESFSWTRSREALAVNAKKAGEGLAFYSRGCQLFASDVQLMINMVTRAAVQGYTLRAREVRLLRRIGKDMLTIIPFVIILIIPLSPLGHVLVFSFIQRFFPDFFPSQFTESRQNIMSMYSSITDADRPDGLPAALLAGGGRGAPVVDAASADAPTDAEGGAADATKDA